MNYLPTSIDGVYIIEPKRFGDSRGYFMETFRLDEFHANVDPGVEFVQCNESVSTRGVLRGLHFQKGEFNGGWQVIHRFKICFSFAKVILLL